MYGPGVMPPQPDGIWESPYNSENGLKVKVKTNIENLFTLLLKEQVHIRHSQLLMSI